MMRQHPQDEDAGQSSSDPHTDPRSSTPILQAASQLRAPADSYSMPDCHLKNHLESTLHLFMD